MRFSAKVGNILNNYSLVYNDVNILQDPEIRVRLSEYSHWPTIPQLFINGNLIGDCEILMELDSKGELKDIFNRAIR